eukprot:362295_1
MANVKRFNRLHRQCIRQFGSIKTSLSCTPTESALGGYIYDFDFSESHALETKYELNKLLLQHQLLIFRSSDNEILSDKDLVRFTQIFGVPQPHTRKNSVYNEEYPEIFMISNVDKYGSHLGADYLPFHADLSYMKGEHIGTIAALCAVELNNQINENCDNENYDNESDDNESDDEMDDIGHTLWMNCYETYNKLPMDIQNKLEEYVGMHRHPIEHQNPDDTFTYHHVIKNHSVTGKKVLYVSPHFTRYIVHKDKKDKYDGESDFSNDILNWLFEHSSRSEFVYKHIWEVGDVLVWDNECTQHSRVAFDGDNYQRVMKRTQIYGPRTRFMIV